MPPVHLFLLFSLLPLLSQGYQDIDIECQDYQENAELCLDGSGSGFGSGDVSLERSGEITLRTVCRGSGLVTMKPVPPVLVERSTYQMVQDCPSEELASEDVASRCQPEHLQPGGSAVEQMPLWLPVTSSATNLTYYNRYCFLCSGDLGPASPWALNVSCSQWLDLQSLSTEAEVLRAAVDSGVCALNLQPPPHVHPQGCASASPPSGLSEVNAEGSPLSILLRFRHWGTQDSGEGEGEGDGEGEGEEGGKGKEPLSCSGFVVRQSGEQTCLPLSCGPGKRLKADRCQPVIDRSRGLQYSLTLLIHLFVRGSDVMGGVTPESLASLCSLEELIKAGVTQKTSQLHSEAYNLTGWILSTHKHAALSSVNSQKDNANDLYFDDSASVLEYQDDYQDNMTVTVKEFRLGQVLVWFDFLVTRDTDRMEVEQTAVRMTEDDWHVVCGNAVARLAPVRKHREDLSVLNGKTSPESDQMFPKVFEESVIHIDYKTMWDKKNAVSMTVSPFLVCPFLTFNNEQYSTEPFADNSSTVNVTVMSETQAVQRADFEIDEEGSMKICRHTFQEKFSQLLVDKETTPNTPDHENIPFWVLVEHYLSLVCVCVSLVCLLLTIVTYSLFRSLRSIPGQNILALCCNLFLAQGSLQFGVNWPELGVGCIALGMVIHYFWLSSILWMNVSSFHMYRVFTARHAARMSSTNSRCCTRRVVAYAVYAQCVPLVVIGATVSSSIFIFQGEQIGYGGEVCYLSMPVLVGASFAAPLGLVLILNLIFFLGAVRAISKTEAPRMEASLQNGHRNPGPNLLTATPFPAPWRRNLNVCIRLSSLTGLFWALGLIAELLDQRVLKMVSVMVNGSQGVLIALSYLPTRRVLRLYAQLCCTCRRQRQQPSSVASYSVPGSSPSSNLAATMTTSAPCVPRQISRNHNSADA